MTGYTYADFAGLIGEPFDLALADGTIQLVLVRAEEQRSGVREEGSFRLEFLGPRAPILPQATYAIGRGDESWVMFIAPISQDDRTTTYEAIFN